MELFSHLYYNVQCMVRVFAGISVRQSVCIIIKWSQDRSFNCSGPLCQKASSYESLSNSEESHIFIHQCDVSGRYKEA